jgi:hypothetical protein
MPSWVIRDLLLDSEPTLSVADLRAARRVLAHQRGWLIPAPPNELCLARVVDPLVREVDGQRLHPSVERSCVNRMGAAAGRLSEAQSLSTTFRKRMPTRVVGIVPDGVDTVTIRFDGGASTNVAVAHNSYEDVLINPSSVSFTGTKRHYVVPLPSVAGASNTPYNSGQASSPFPE